jgi:hypothetical protein
LQRYELLLYIARNIALFFENIAFAAIKGISFAKAGVKQCVFGVDFVSLRKTTRI